MVHILTLLLLASPVAGARTRPRLNCAVSYQNVRDVSIPGGTVGLISKTMEDGFERVDYQDDRYSYRAEMKPAGFAYGHLMIRDRADLTDLTDFEGYQNSRFVFRVRRKVTDLVIRGEVVATVTLACNLAEKK